MESELSVEKKPTQFSLDDILRVVGKFGLYQGYLYALICCGTLLSSSYSFGFVFTTGEVDYRCHIPECENRSTAEYEADWLHDAIPFEKDLPKTCSRYLPTASSTNLSCSAEYFDSSVEIECSDVIFDDYENTIVNTFNLTCNEQWKISLVGTAHYLAFFLNLLTSGYFSDIYGRKVVFIFSTFCAGIFAIIRSFAWSYLSFIILEFIDTLFVGGVYTAGFLLAIELLNPEYRALGGVLVFGAASIGQIVVGLLAWWLRDWKLLLRVSNAPALILGVMYIFLLPESFRWLLSKGQNQKVAKYLIKSSQINRIEMPSDIKDVLENRPQDILLDSPDSKENTSSTVANEYNIKEIFKYPAFLLRIAICVYCWMANVFIFYGLTFTSVALGGNKYTDFAFAALVELPALVIVLYGAQRWGRKILVVSAFFVSSVALIASAFVSDVYWVQLILFLIGKFSITISFSTMFTLTSEIFPTNLRHTLFGFCSAFGRLGSIIATQAPLLRTVHLHLPTYLFAGAALIAGVLSLTFPETNNTKLPDSLDDAMNLGKIKNKNEHKS